MVVKSVRFSKTWPCLRKALISPGYKATQDCSDGRFHGLEPVYLPAYNLKNAQYVFESNFSSLFYPVNENVAYHTILIVRILHISLPKNFSYSKKHFQQQFVNYRNYYFSYRVTADFLNYLCVADFGLK